MLLQADDLEAILLNKVFKRDTLARIEAFAIYVRKDKGRTH